MQRLRRSLRSLMRLVVAHHHPLLYCGQWVRDVLILCGHGCYRPSHIYRSTRNGRSSPWKTCKRGHC